MSYKENCKAEGEIMTRYKIAKAYFSGQATQLEISSQLGCHRNTVYGVIGACRAQPPNSQIWMYLRADARKLTLVRLLEVFEFLGNLSRKPHSNKRSIQPGSPEEALILAQHEESHRGVKRTIRTLTRRGEDKQIFSVRRVTTVFRRHKLKIKKIRTINGERRPLYNYESLAAFEQCQYDTKEITDKHALPKEIYERFKNNSELPIYQWTFIDVKTKTRFLAWSHHLSSTFGFRFLEFVINWLRSHGVTTKIHVQMDMGREFYQGLKWKQAQWNSDLAKYNAYVFDTEGAKYKQNIVERSHRTDDEEFYCPRGSRISSKAEFLVEAQFWIIYFNKRSHDGIGMNGLSPKEKLEKLGHYNANQICNFPCLILEDFFQPFMAYFNPADFEQKKESISQNVLTPYQNQSLCSDFYKCGRRGI